MLRAAEFPFLFQVRGSWEFVVCTNNDNPEVPTLISPPEDEPGSFQDGEYQGFCLSGDYGSDVDASYLQFEAVEDVIRNCVKKFVETNDPNGPFRTFALSAISPKTTRRGSVGAGV